MSSPWSDAGLARVCLGTARGGGGGAGPGPRRPAVAVVRRYDAVPELDLSRAHPPEPPPLDAFARLAWAGIRLRDDGRWLVARVPRALAASAGWPRFDRLLARHAPYLADLAALAATVRERIGPGAVAARLRAVVPPLLEVAAELAGGRRRLERLRRRPLAGARLDLACVLYAQLVQIEGVVGRALDGASRDGDATETAPNGRLLPFRSC